jgi:putative transposase
MQISDVKKMKDIEAENARLKRMYAELSIVNDALKQLLEKKL